MTQKQKSAIEVLEPESALRNQFDLLTPGLRKKAEMIPSDIFDLKPMDLEEKIQPTVLMRRLKKRFWQEYQRALARNEESISPIAVYQDLCTRQYFYFSIVNNEEIFAWLLSPLTDFDLMTEEALEFSIERIRAELLTLPLYDAKGKFDNYAAGTLLAAAKFLDARVKGSPLQRIEQKNLTVNLHKNSGAVSKDDLNKELEEIRQRLNMHQTPQLTQKMPDDTE
jgi:hypothetical protein